MLSFVSLKQQYRKPRALLLNCPNSTTPKENSLYYAAAVQPADFDICRLRFPLDQQSLRGLQAADNTTLNHISRISIYPLPIGWEAFAEKPVTDDRLGFLMLSNIDHRAECQSLQEHVSATIREITDTDQTVGLYNKLLLASYDYVSQMPLPVLHEQRTT